jgi:hypothetical protein
MRKRWMIKASACSRLLAPAGIVLLALIAVAPAAAAAAPAPWWQVYSEVSPSNLPPEHEGEPGHEGEGTLVIVVGNLGAGPASGATGTPVLITDKLPHGLTATSIGGQSRNHTPTTCTLATLQCSFAGTLYPYQRLAVSIKVKVELPAGTVTTLPNDVTVEGGGARDPSLSTQRLTVNGAPTTFGVQAGGYELAPYNQDGTPATQAGAHPFQLTSTLVLNQTGEGASRQPVALPRNLHFELPTGLVGNPDATEQCSMTDFTAHVPVSEVDQCPPTTAVGVAIVTIQEPEIAHLVTVTVPLFNLVPAEGEPARFGFEALGLVPVVIDTSLAPGGDYDVVASVKNATELAGLLSSQVAFWGVPGDPSHNQSRGWECIEGGRHFESGEVDTPCPSSSDLPQTPLLTLPTYCAADPASEPVTSSMEVESWAHPGFLTPPVYVWSGPLEEPLAFRACEELQFTPAISVTPEHQVASTPTGLSVDVKVPQSTTLEAEARAEADVRDTTVTLPAGVQVNPSAANGLQACSEADIGFIGFEDFQEGSPTATFSEGFDFTPPAEPKPGEAFCPEASKVGTVRIRTPLLPTELEGAVYLAQPAPNGEAGKNPFDSLIALYLVAEDKQAGVLVKLAGEGQLDPATGQITTSFKNTPQLPFEELKLELFGGERASLSTPAQCGSYQASSVFDAWSGAVTQPASEPFTITSGVGGGPCPSGTLGFSPGFLAQGENTQAGAFTPFEVEITRPDGQQALSGVTVSLPPGVAALLSTVTPCQEPPPGVEWDCGEDSLIGHSTAESGLGRQPVVLGGDAYLTSGYDGAPFGLLVRTKAEAGPFDLGYVNVRSRINVNPETAAVTITTDPGPHGDALITMLKGIPVQLKRLLVNVDRPDFEFNPTNCDPMSIAGVLDGSEGASAQVSSHFQVGGCQGLPFHPTLEASTEGHASKAGGASLTVKVTSAGLGQANIRKVFLTIPKILPSRLQPTLQHACLAAVFEANPAGCDEDSLIGYATVHTPVLKSPLTGPAYVVSHGGAGFPDVEFVLQGEGIELILDGKTQIKDGVTYSRFESTPDAPFTSFETVLPEGPHSILAVNTEEAPNYDLCSHNITIPTEITAQNGAILEQTTKVAITGCTGVKGFKAKLTRVQLLAKALKACKKDKKKTKRVACERAARKKYAAKASKTSKKKKK